jgi:hypothetical protein
MPSCRRKPAGIPVARHGGLLSDRDGFRRPGEYSGNGLYWRDRKSGILYHVHAIETEECEVQGTDRGVDRWRSMLSRLVRAPTVIGCRFDAVTDGAAHVAGSVSFSRHARPGVHDLDDLDPASPEPKTTDRSQSLVWTGDRRRAAAAFASLEEILGARGWKLHRESGAHWYSRRYRRPVILWDQPVHAAEVRARSAGLTPPSDLPNENRACRSVGLVQGHTPSPRSEWPRRLRGHR